jgi:DNA-directed RNA polymerase subunit E'/Rpb7
MFLIYTIEDKITLKPDSLNSSSEFSYEDIILSKTREKYIGKVLLNHGIVVTIKKLQIRNSLIVEIEGIINVDVFLFLL